MTRRRAEGQRLAKVDEFDGIVLVGTVSCRSAATSYRGSFGRSSEDGTVEA
jgi:hypothetical protein